MAWGFQRFLGIGPKASEGEPVSDSDPSHTHVLPEIVHDTQTDHQALWLTVGIVVVALSAGGGFLAGRATVPAQSPASAEDYDDGTSVPAPSPKQPAAAAANEPAQPHRHYSHPGELQGAAVISAAKPATGTVYVHRMNSDLRDQPSYDAQVIKKEAKGAQVQMIAVSDKWTEVQDGAIKGWMRSSVLKDTPPGEKRPRKSD